MGFAVVFDVLSDDVAALFDVREVVASADSLDDDDVEDEDDDFAAAGLRVEGFDVDPDFLPPVAVRLPAVVDFDPLAPLPFVPPSSR